MIYKKIKKSGKNDLDAFINDLNNLITYYKFNAIFSVKFFANDVKLKYYVLFQKKMKIFLFAFFNWPIAMIFYLNNNILLYTIFKSQFETFLLLNNI